MNKRSYKLPSSSSDVNLKLLKSAVGKSSFQLSGAVIYVIVLSLIFGVFAIKPTLSTISGLLKKIEDQEVVLKSLKQKVKELEVAQENLQQIEPITPALERAIPSEINLKEVTDIIESLSLKHNLTYSTLSSRELTYKIKNEEAEEIETISSVNDFGLSLILSGSYFDIKAMIQDISRSQRYLYIDDYTIKEVLTNDTAKGTGLEVALTLRAFTTRI